MKTYKKHTAALCKLCRAILLAVFIFVKPVSAEPTSDILDFDLKDLMQMELTIATKKPQRLIDTPAAVYVLTGDDIRRTGVTTIADALRLVPGFEVAKVSSSQWAVSSRGFNNRFSNKLLVMIDGRTVYTPLFGGVYWDEQDLMLEDVDRIEVVRGPGGSIWGANAVNGVVNIITKRAKDTQGPLATAGGGSYERAFAGARYGGQIGESTFYRIYAKAFDRDNFRSADGDPANDDWGRRSAGFRAAHQATENDNITLQGDIYSANEDLDIDFPATTPPFLTHVEEESDLNGGNLLGNWKHTLSDKSQVALRLYYDRTHRNEAFLNQTHDTYDISVDHNTELFAGNELNYGLEYRFISDELRGKRNISFDPQSRDLDLFSVFVQDQHALIEDLLQLTVGSKLEHNDYTGFEVEPTVRLLWTPQKDQVLWTAFSRGVRTPSRADNDVNIAAGVIPVPGVGLNGLALAGSDQSESENLYAYEAGFRSELREDFSVDLSVFSNHYNDLSSAELSSREIQGAPVPALISTYTFRNGLDGEVNGGELSGDWKALDWWRLVGGYSFRTIHYASHSNENILAGTAESGTGPEHTGFLRSHMDFGNQWEFDSILRAVDSIGSAGIPSYVEADVRLAWKPSKNLELAVIGQNLLDHDHPEFNSDFILVPQTEVPRGVYAKATWTLH